MANQGYTVSLESVDWLVCVDMQVHLHLCFVHLFVLRFYGQVNPFGSCRARSVYLVLQAVNSIVHILLPETGICPSSIRRRERP